MSGKAVVEAGVAVRGTGAGTVLGTAAARAATLADKPEHRRSAYIKRT